MSNELCHIEFDPLETFAMFKTEEQRFGRCHSPKTVRYWSPSDIKIVLNLTLSFYSLMNEIIVLFIQYR